MGYSSECMFKVDNVWLCMDIEVNLMMIVGVWFICLCIMLVVLC